MTVCCWKWGRTFEPVYVNRLQAMLARHLHMPHELVCITDDAQGIDPSIRVLPLPRRYVHTPRCRRRMQIFDGAFARAIGDRILAIDLDVVIVDDITPIVNRPEPLVGWKVKHAQVYSGSFFLMNAGALQGLYDAFAEDPEGYPSRVQPRGVPSDQAMLNHWLRSQPPIPFWTEQHGFVTYFGDGYEEKEHFGVGPNRPHLPPGARIVVLGSADKAVMDEGRFDWVRRHWSSREVAA